MKTIHKLVLKSFLGPLVLTFLIVLFVLMMNFVWRYIDDLVGKGLDASVILELLMYATANTIPMGLPLAMLLAGIMTLGNLGENYELLAMKSAGMSLPKILQPLIFVSVLIAVGSFFVVNDLLPYSNRKMMSIIYDIKQQNQVLEFRDGLFFNGMENMSIRVDKQDKDTKLLRNILIYDNRDYTGNMNETVADSGYIRLSDDKRFLMVTLFNGNRYDLTRNSDWFTKNQLQHQTFEQQKGVIPMFGYDFQRSDANEFSNSTTKNINELQKDIDSLNVEVGKSTTASYEPLLREQIFSKDKQALGFVPDSLKQDKSQFKMVLLTDSLARLSYRAKNDVWSSAISNAESSRSFYSFDESMSKDALNQLYKSEVEWHRKISLPISILIFFLIGAPLGAIIRKGGLGTPIVISIAFFVIYYVISLYGEKMAKEGTWDAVYGMWLSAIILTPIAIFLTIKATRDSSLLDVDWYRGKWLRVKAKSIAMFTKNKTKQKI